MGGADATTHGEVAKRKASDVKANVTDAVVGAVRAAKFVDVVEDRQNISPATAADDANRVALGDDATIAPEGVVLALKEPGALQRKHDRVKLGRRPKWARLALSIEVPVPSSVGIHDARVARGLVPVSV